MKKLIIISIFIFFTMLTEAQSYLQYSRVKESYKEKSDFLIKLLTKQSLKVNNVNILITAFKKEEKLIVWAKHKDSTKYDTLIIYNFCYLSGQLGPKRKEGDLQVPEGFYHISSFNPYSNFYLSLKINYPNKSDLILSDKQRPGGDIFIHGACVSIGCIPITDDKIKELYLLACFANENGQSQIPVYIFPFEMTKQNFDKYSDKDEYLKNIKFWGNLKQGYDIFVNNKKKLNFTVSTLGEYIFKN